VTLDGEEEKEEVVVLLLLLLLQEPRSFPHSESRAGARGMHTERA
jgi:hypothetical protein